MRPIPLLMLAVLVASPALAGKKKPDADKVSDASGQVRSAVNQLRQNDPRAALRSTQAVQDALKAGASLDSDDTQALLATQIGAHAALAGEEGEDAAEHLDLAMKARATCLDQVAGDPTAKDKTCVSWDKEVAKVLRWRASQLQVALSKHTVGASAVEARTRCQQAAQVAPEPWSDDRCLAVLALLGGDADAALATATSALARLESGTVPTGNDVQNLDQTIAYSAQVIGWSHGRFEEARDLVLRAEGSMAMAGGDALPEVAQLRPSLEDAAAKLGPARDAAHAGTDPAAWGKWIATLDAAGLHTLGAREAALAVAAVPKDVRVQETAGVLLINAAANAKAKGATPAELRALFTPAAAAFDTCLQILPKHPRCGEHKAKVAGYIEALGTR